jgi:hypothetical protein
MKNKKQIILNEMIVHGQPTNDFLFVAYRGDVWVFDYNEYGDDNFTSSDDKVVDMVRSILNDFAIDIDDWSDMGEIEAINPDVYYGRVIKNEMYMANQKDFSPRTSLALHKLAKQFKVEYIYTNRGDLSLASSFEENPEYVYHGTRFNYLKSILKLGISPSISKSNWEHSNIRHPDKVFFTNNEQAALFHAAHSSRDKMDIPVIIRLKVPDQHKLIPDYDVNWTTKKPSDEYKKAGYIPVIHGAKSEMSPMRRSKEEGIFGYKGRIPATFIVEIYLPKFFEGSYDDLYDGSIDDNYRAYSVEYIKEFIEMVDEYDFDTDTINAFLGHPIEDIMNEMGYDEEEEEVNESISFKKLFYGDNSLIKEKTIPYFIPKSDKKRLMYDFYMVMNLNPIIENLGAGSKNIGGREIQTQTARTGNINTNVLDSFNKAKEDIISYLEVHLLEAVFFAVCAEFRHAYTYDLKEVYNKKLNDTEKQLLKYHQERYNHAKHRTEYMVKDRTKGARRSYLGAEVRSEGYRNSYKAAIYAINKVGSTKTEFIKLANKIFNIDAWDGTSYGGKAWANITKGYLHLKYAQSELEKMVAIDHIYDLQHNTDTVFNKLQSYYQEGYSWIKTALDERANIKSPYVLYKNISPPIKQISGYILKADGYQSWEDYIKSETNEEKSTIKHNSAIEHITPIEKKVPWKGGTWKGGTWDDGIWKGGTWKNGIWDDGIWKGGTWKNGTWEDGTWDDGIWKNGTWDDGIWKNGTWDDGIWKGGIWKGGIWKNGIWEGGTWKNGIWKGGTWEFGIWDDGIWEFGIWKGGRIWDGSKYVKSDVSPPEFFANKNKNKEPRPFRQI